MNGSVVALIFSRSFISYKGSLLLENLVRVPSKAHNMIFLCTRLQSYVTQFIVPKMETVCGSMAIVRNIHTQLSTSTIEMHSVI